MRPALLGWIFGILCLQTLPRLYPLWLLPALALLCIPFIHWGRHHPPLRPPIVFLLCCLAGFNDAGERSRIRLQHQLSPSWDHRTLQMSGTITSLVETRPTSQRFSFCPDPNPDLPATLDLTRFNHAPDLQSPNFSPGQRWRFDVQLKRPHSLINPGGFDGETWAWSEGILAQGSINSKFSAQFLGWDHPSDEEGLRILLEQFRSQLRTRMQHILGDRRWSAVLIALVIGDQSAISQEDWKLFWSTGVGHLVSISGLHITLLAGLVAKTTGLVWPSRRLRWLSGWLGATAYSLIAGFSLPTQRTLYGITVVTATGLLQRPLPPFTGLLLACALVLAKDPWAPLAAGFWLSFGAVAWLMYAGAYRTGHFPWWAEGWNTQWAATWSLLPLLVWLFGQVSWISPLANAIAVPVVSLAVVPLALLGLVPGLSVCLIWSHDLFALTAAILHFLVDHSPPQWILPTPTLPVLLGATLGVGFLLAPRGLPGRWGGIIGLLGLAASPLPRPPFGSVWINILDVGQGLSMVIRTQHHTLVVDTGPRYSPEHDAGERVLVPALHSFGITHLDGLVLSHQDLDHTGGTASLLQGYAIPWVLSPLASEHPLIHPIPRHLTCYAGQFWNWDGVHFEVLHPLLKNVHDSSIKTNDRACVLRLGTETIHFLLPADIEAPSERELVARAPDSLHADLLVAPHHGSKTSSTAEFLAAVSPQWSIFSVGDHNHFHHPHPLVWERYGALPSIRLRTDRCGAIAVQGESTRLTLRSQRAEFPHYWEVPCADPAHNSLGLDTP
ncbi:MAG: DNA internalization-related competence protein ComEC/Rec2 [Ferrovum sp.]|nr:DNA internalization-related competence protein ComEC/Rec2 [Ferrovum sp.]NDU87717.1 DNA internalization-related competence protein ComEC/Rec2 [Ferrovum sp.]